MSQQKLFSTNIQKLRTQKNLSQDQLALDLGMTRSKVSALENGQTKNPTVEDLLAFSKFYGISIDTLLKTDLGFLSELKLKEIELGHDSYATGSRIRIHATTVDPQNNDNVEMVTAKAKMGYLEGYGDPEFISQLPVFHLPHLPKGKKYRMFPGEGDSMLPVPANSWLMGSYMEDWTQIKDNSPCIVVTIEDGITFKMVDNHFKDSRSLVLRPLNPVYETKEVNVKDVKEVWAFEGYFSKEIPDGDPSVREMAKAISDLSMEVKKMKKN